MPIEDYPCRTIEQVLISKGASRDAPFGEDDGEIGARLFLRWAKTSTIAPYVCGNGCCSCPMGNDSCATCGRHSPICMWQWDLHMPQMGQECLIFAKYTAHCPIGA